MATLTMDTQLRAMVLGVWEGLLLCYIVEYGRGRPASDPPSSTEQSLKIAGIGLSLGVGGRLVLDYSTTGDVEILARGVVGMTVGVLIAEFGKQAMAMFLPQAEPEHKSRRHRHRRIHTRHDEEVLEGAVPLSSGMPPMVTPQTAPMVGSSLSVPLIAGRPSMSSSSHHLATAPMVTVPVITAPAISSSRVPPSVYAPRDLLRSGRRDIALPEEEESEESLERDVNVAAGRRRKLQEEREWAKAQGDAARSAQLDAEIKRFKALSAELERKLKKRRSLAWTLAVTGSGSVRSGLPKLAHHHILYDNRNNSSHRGPELGKGAVPPVTTSSPMPSQFQTPLSQPAIASQLVAFPYTLDTPGAGPGPTTLAQNIPSVRSASVSLPSAAAQTAQSAPITQTSQGGTATTARPFYSPRVSFTFTPLSPVVPPSPPQHHIRPRPSKSSLRSSNLSRSNSLVQPVQATQVVHATAVPQPMVAPATEPVRTISLPVPSGSLPPRVVASGSSVFAAAPPVTRSDAQTSSAVPFSTFRTVPQDPATTFTTRMYTVPTAPRTQPINTIPLPQSSTTVANNAPSRSTFQIQPIPPFEAYPAAIPRPPRDTAQPRGARPRSSSEPPVPIYLSDLQASPAAVHRALVSQPPAQVDTQPLLRTHSRDRERERERERTNAGQPSRSHRSRHHHHHEHRDHKPSSRAPQTPSSSGRVPVEIEIVPITPRTIPIRHVAPGTSPVAGPGAEKLVDTRAGTGAGASPEVGGSGGQGVEGEDPGIRTSVTTVPTSDEWSRALD